MGALSGSLTYTKFHVRGDLPNDYKDRYLESIRYRAFRPLKPSDEEDERMGWCNISQPFDFELDYNKVIWEPYLNLGFRLDRFRIPRAIFKAHYQEAEAKRLDELGTDKLNRGQKDELKFIITRKLREMVLPAMRVVDMSWNVERAELRFFNTSNRMHELFADLFEETFKLDLVPDGAYVAATHMDLDETTLAAFDTAEPSLFALDA